MSLLNNWYTLQLVILFFVILLPRLMIKKYDIYIFLSLTILSILSILLRPLTFSDDENYLSIIDGFRNSTAIELGKISTLFYYMNLIILSIFDNIEYTLKFNFILVWLIFAFSLIKERVKYKTMYFIFFYLLFQVLFYIQLRNALAIVFLAWAIIRTFSHKNGLLLFIISIMFHYSVLPFVILFFLFKYFYSPTTITPQKIVLIILSSIFLSFSVYNIYLNYIQVNPFFEKYFLEYINTPEVGNTSILQLFLLFLHSLLLYKTKSEVKSNLFIDKSLILTLTGLFFGILLFTMPLFQRIIVPFYLYAIISFVYIFKTLNYKIYKIPYLILISIYIAISINRIAYFENWFIF